MSFSTPLSDRASSLRSLLLPTSTTQARSLGPLSSMRWPLTTSTRSSSSTSRSFSLPLCQLRPLNKSSPSSTESTRQPSRDNISNKQSPICRTSQDSPSTLRKQQRSSKKCSRVSSPTDMAKSLALSSDRSSTRTRPRLPMSSSMSDRHQRPRPK